MASTFTLTCPMAGPLTWPSTDRAKHEGGGDTADFVGVLDRVSAGPVAAWSLSRALKASLIGQKLFDLRRSTDNATLSIYAGIDGNADLSGYSAWAGGGAVYCSRVYDQSGNGKDWVQSTGGNQPKFKMAGPGGHPAVFDDNTRNATLTMPGGSPVNGMFATGGSSYIAVRVGTDLGGSAVHKGSIRTCQFFSSGAAGGHTRIGFTYPWSGSSFSEALWITSSPTTWPAGEAHVVTIEYSASSAANSPAFYLDDEQADIVTARPAVGSPGADVGDMVMFSYQPDGQEISEYILFDQILPIEDRVLLNSDMVNRYSD